MAEDKIREIDWLRGFATFLVVLGHSIIVFPVDLHAVPWCRFLFETLSSFHMALFFAISGFCFSMRGGYWSYIRRKARLLLIPYICFSLIGIIPRYFFPSLVNGSESLSESVISILLYGGDIWFLYTLFIIFAVFPLVRNAAEKAEIMTVSAVIVLALFSAKAPKLFCINSALYYLSFFTLGYTARKHSVFSIRDKTETMTEKQRIIAVLICLAVLLACGYLHMNLGNTVLNFIEGCAGITACFVLTLVLPKLTGAFEPISRYSLPIYLLNGYWLVISRTLAVRVLKLSSAALIISVNLAIDLFISYLVIKYILERIPLVRDVIGIH